ncbi:hypothetical protein T06_11849 [Trichinella sp. T6]|nr:hypothetical protein T06_11849 [Trichinella sp. T6]
MITSGGLKNGAKKKRNHGKHDAEQEKRRVKYFRIRGRHEAEQEKTKFLDPNSVGLGLGYFERAFIFLLFKVVDQSLIEMFTKQSVPLN